MTLLKLAGPLAGLLLMCAQGTVWAQAPAGAAIAPPATASPAPAAAMLGLTTTISGPGSVVFSAGNVTRSCDATCSLSFASGSRVALTPQPRAGHRFAGWSGACSGTGPCAVTMGSASAVSAVFNALAATGPLVQWRAPRTLANGTPLAGLAGYRVYASQTRYDLAPALVQTVSDATAQSTIVPGLAAGTWHFWVSAVSSSYAESEMQYVASAVVP